MINSIKFRMGSGLSIPIYADWIKVKAVNIEEDHLVISAVNGVPVDIGIAFDELNLGLIIIANDNVDFMSVDQDLDRLQYNAMEFDLYRRSMKIGLADVFKLRDLDSWRYINGVPVELQLRVKVLEDDDGFNGLAITAEDEVAALLMKKIKSVVRDDYSISVSDNIDDTAIRIERGADIGFNHGMTEHLPVHDVTQTLSDAGHDNIILSGSVEPSPGVDLMSTYETEMLIHSDAKAVPSINLDHIDNGMIQITGGEADLASVVSALQGINNGLEIDGDEFDVTLGVSVLQNEGGESCLVLSVPDDITPDLRVPCTGITVPSNTMSFTYDGENKTIEYTLTPAETTDTVSITSSDTSIIQIANDVATAVGVGSAQITITCGEQSTTINVYAALSTGSSSRAINQGVEGGSWSDGDYARTVNQVSGGSLLSYLGAINPWGDGRYITNDSVHHSPPYKLPANCNIMRMTLPVNGRYSDGETYSDFTYSILFFDSTSEGKNAGTGESGYARWLSTYSGSVSSNVAITDTILVDPRADSFAISYSLYNGYNSTGLYVPGIYHFEMDHFDYYDYIQGDGTAFIDTGLNAQTYGADAYEKEIKFVMTSFQMSSGQYPYVTGATNAWGVSGFYICGETSSSNNTLYVMSNQQYANTTVTLSSRDELVTIKTVGMDTYYNGNLIYTASNSTVTINSAMNIPLFTRANYSNGDISYNGYYINHPCPVKIYEYTVRDSNGVAVAHMVPAKCDGNNAIGMYDTVRGIFFTNANSTGSFTVGNDSN